MVRTSNEGFTAFTSIKGVFDAVVDIGVFEIDTNAGLRPSPKGHISFSFDNITKPWPVVVKESSVTGSAAPARLENLHKT